MIVEKLTTSSMLERLESEWVALESRMVSIPFVAHDWVAAWWNTLRSEGLKATDSLCGLVFRNAATGGLCGVAPLMMTTRPGRGPLRLAQLQFIGADSNLTELRCVAAPEDQMETVYLSLVEHLHRERVRCDWIKFTGIPTAAVATRIAEAFGPSHETHVVPDFILPLKPTWEELRATLPRNIRESLRKCYNAPRRDNVQFDLVKITDGPALDSAIAEVLRLHAARAGVTDTVIHPNVFRLEASQRFLHEVCRRFAARGRLRIYQLRHGDAVVATRIGFVCNDSLYLYYSGYDPAYAQYSVMTRVVAEAIQDAIATGLASVNLSVGRDVAKERWRPVEVHYHQVEVVMPRWSSLLRYRMFKSAHSGFKESWLGRLISRG